MPSTIINKIKNFFEKIFSAIIEGLIVFFGWLGLFFGIIFRFLKRVFIPVFEFIKKAVIFAGDFLKKAFIPVFTFLIKAFSSFFIFLKKSKVFTFLSGKISMLFLIIKKKIGKTTGINFDDGGKQKIELALDDLKKELVFFDLFNMMLNSIIVFLGALLVCIVFDLSWQWAVLVWLIGTGIFGYYYIKNTRLVNVEGKVPELEERLRTAADNINKNNEITNDLKEEVVHDMKKIKSDLFIDINSIGVRLFSIIIIAFIVVIVSFMGLTFDFEFSEAVSNPAGYMKTRVFGGDAGNVSNIDFIKGENLGDIYGNRTELVKLGDESISLEVRPLQTEMDFQDVQDVENRNFNPPVYPKEIYTSHDASYSETISKKNQAVVKSYFEQISQ